MFSLLSGPWTKSRTLDTAGIALLQCTFIWSLSPNAATASSATLNSRPHRHSRGIHRPEVRGLRHSRGHLSRGAVSAKPKLTGREWSEQKAVHRKSKLVDSGNPKTMRTPETDRRLLEV